MKIGIIGGSGIYTLRKYKLFRKNLDNKYENRGFYVEKYKFADCEIYFLPRHGQNHEILPHQIDYLVNMKFFATLGVNFILSLCTVGSLSSKFKPGAYVIPKDIVDLTQTRKGSNYVEGNKHINMGDIFNKNLVSVCLKILRKSKLNVINDGVLVVTEGPRFATTAEQKMYRNLGGNLLNMTQAQEIYLAHVFKIPFVSLCHITDQAEVVNKSFDIKSSPAIKIFKNNFVKVERILSSLVSSLDEDVHKIKYYNKKKTFI